MADERLIFLIILALNTLMVLLYLLWGWKRKVKGYVPKAIVMFLCPITGGAFFLLSYVLYRVFFSEPVDLSDVVFSKERIKAVTHAEEDRERNMVPLEEAIEITDEKNLRTLMMNVVRGDIAKYLASISLALNSEDTEAAHYAASVLQDALNNFRMTVERQRQLILQGGEEQRILAEELIDYMNQVLEQRVFTDMEQYNYVEIMDDICEIYYNGQPEAMNNSQYEAISMRLLEIRDFDKCGKWCERARYHYPNTLSTYTCQLKLYFTNGQKQRFFEVIEELRQSAVVVDSETLELIRVFQ
ncbi:MAG: hypothetical protein NC079_04895 [Clostridium sp.]|nr:hypothetical protein [Acetatifactor muris]MCM1526253.1 hypothetical protein [Bacteroides sp.]MCM1562930.1 hypothetical protein [Clostridium sp.]